MIERNGDLHRFLHQEIASDESLRMLLFLARHGEQSWTVDELRQRLGIEEDGVSAVVAAKRLELRLEALIEKRLVQRIHGEGRYRYSPDSASSQNLVQRLIDADDAERAEAGRMIYIAPRVSGARAFADAFSAPRGRP